MQLLMPAAVNLDPNEVYSSAELTTSLSSVNTLQYLHSSKQTTSSESQTVTAYTTVYTTINTTVYTVTDSNTTTVSWASTAGTDYQTEETTVPFTTEADITDWTTTSTDRTFPVLVNSTSLVNSTGLANSTGLVDSTGLVNSTTLVDNDHSGNATDWEEESVDDQHVRDDLVSKNKGAEKLGFPMKSPLDSTIDPYLRHHSQCF